MEYLKRAVIDYKASLYTFHLKPDFKTITSYSKYTGIYPTNIPISSMSESIEDVTDVTLDVEFTYDNFEYMDQDIIREMNLLTSGEPITYESLQQSSTLGFLGLATKKRHFIYQIDKSPFFEIDLNGLQSLLRSDGCDISSTPASLFGAKFGGTENSYLPAPFNEESVNISVGGTLTKNYSNKVSKIIEKKYDI